LDASPTISIRKKVKIQKKELTENKKKVSIEGKKVQDEWRPIPPKMDGSVPDNDPDPAYDRDIHPWL